MQFYMCFTAFLMPVKGAEEKNDYRICLRAMQITEDHGRAVNNIVQ